MENYISFLYIFCIFCLAKKIHVVYYFLLLTHMKHNNTIIQYVLKPSLTLASTNNNRECAYFSSNFIIFNIFNLNFSNSLF